ncbi:hypothetical protein Enr10x_60430 [Gimesia panareensis]|uniref:Uncharacterized protein n=1 Tax=Gimesia panareensis TaxID=2527978 RepID=A0A517QGF5_9PLAN|nr:hypothetical protein Enr10x_60430 [Gimesia panareensis]
MYEKKTGENRPHFKAGLPIYLHSQRDQEHLMNYI